MNATLEWFPLLPTGIVLGLAVALAGVLAYGSWLLAHRRVPRRWLTVLGALRVGMIVLFVLGLLRPVLSFPRQVAVAPGALVLIDTSASMAQAGANGGTRLDEVRQALRESPALEAARHTHRLSWYAFDRRAHPLTPDALADVSPRGDGTDLAASLASACQHIRLLNAASGANSIPSRALLVSDGQDQGAADAVTAARELGLVVDVLGPRPAAGRASPAATIADVECARRVLLGSETEFQVALRADAAANGLTLVLEEDGREVQRRQVGALGAGQETRVVLADRPSAPGPKRYVVRLWQGNTEIASPRAVNIQVSDQRHDVLLLEDTWRWEFKYLHRLLEDDPSFSVTALLSRDGRAHVEFGEPERGVELGGYPRTRGDLAGFDTFILGNVDPHVWPRGLVRYVHDAVADDGKSLVVVAGPRLGTWTDVVELAQLLPVELTRESGTPISGPVELRATAEGEASGWFALEPREAGAGGSTSATEAPSPARPPPVEQVYPVLRKRPAATVLLEATRQTNAYGPLIVMAEHTVGRGRVLFIAADTLWRWQTLGPRNDAGATLYTAFWQHALRAMAPPEPASSSNQLWLRPERTLYRSGERVRLTAEWRSEAAEAAASLTAVVVLPDGRRLPLDLTPQERDPHRLTGQFDVATAGQYRVEAAVRTDARVIAEMTTMLEATPRPAEQDEAPVDVAALARLAAATGGRIIDPSTADGWLPEAPSAAPTIVERRSFDLWRNFTLLLALGVLMAADWSLRLFRGYV